MQSRYYDPEVGRFINADAFAATGQGILGNNMFAYCNNNPVINVDPTGHALMQLSFDPDGASGLLTPGPWGGGSGGSSGMAYWANISPEAAKELANDVGEAIRTGAEACWNFYMQICNRQQEAQLQKALALNEGVKYFAENPKQAEEAIRGMVGVSTSITALIAAVSAGGPVVSLAATVVVTLWDMGWTLYDIICDFR